MTHSVIVFLPLGRISLRRSGTGKPNWPTVQPLKSKNLVSHLLQRYGHINRKRRTTTSTNPFLLDRLTEWLPHSGHSLRTLAKTYIETRHPAFRGSSHRKRIVPICESCRTT